MTKQLLCGLMFTLCAASGMAQGRGNAPAQTTPPASDSTPRVETAGEKEEKISQTSHAMRLDGREIKYTATAGTLPIRLDNGQVSARMFFGAYTKDGEDAKTRPVSLLYNGRPGGATLQAGRQRELAPRRHRSGLHRRHRHRLQPRRLRRQQRAVPRRARRPAGVRRVHQQLPEGLQPLAVAEVPDRRELRNDPFGRPRAGAAEPP